MGQKGRGRLTKILPARQTYFWEFFGQPFGENTFSENAPPPRQISRFNSNFGYFLIWNTMGIFSSLSSQFILYEVGTKFDDGGTKFDELGTKYNPEVIKHRF